MVNANSVTEAENLTSNTLTPPTSSPIAFALADSGCTDTVIRESDVAQYVVDCTPTANGITIVYPNGTTAKSIATGYLRLSVPTLRIVVHILRDCDLHTSLISIGQLCNQGCTVVLTASSISVKHSTTGVTVMAGSKASSASLWPLHEAPQPTTSSPVNLAQRHVLNADYVNWASACLGAPPASSLLKAARNGWLAGFPRLTPEMISANMPNPIATALGHLQANRQGQRSTKLVSNNESSPPTSTTGTDPSIDADTDHVQLADETTSLICAVVSLTEADLRAHADLMGRFPFPSHLGHQYILVSTYLGYIHMEAMRDRTGPSYVTAFTATINFYATLGLLKPKIYRMDNERSALVDKLFTQHALHREYVPKGDHRANKAERAINDAKSHFISMLCLVHRAFPIQYWNELLPQAEATLNLLRPWHADRKLSAYHGMHKHQYDFNAHPLAPVGTLVVVHNARPPAGDRLSWSPHGHEGFYLGPALDHYRSFRVYDIVTKGLRTSNSLSWHPAPFPMPGSSAIELSLAAIADLAAALTAAATAHVPPTERQPFLERATSITDSLRALVDQFTNPLPADSAAPQPHYQGASRTSRGTAPVTLGPPPGLPPPGGTPAPPPRVELSAVAAPRVEAAAAPPLPSPATAAAHAPSPVAPQRVVEAPVATPAAPPNAAPGARRAPPSPPARMVTRARSRGAQVNAVATAQTPRARRPNAAWARRVPLVAPGAASSVHPPPRLLASPAQPTVPRPFCAPSASKSTLLAPPVMSDLLPPDYALTASVPALGGDLLSIHFAHCAVRRAYANHASGSQSTTVDISKLNLTADGRPLTYRAALAGEDASRWRTAEVEELIRLIRTSKTLVPIPRDSVPTDRRRDVTYYNPQVKEKVDAAGNKTFRVRGTAGGDRITYPGEVSAQVADLDAVKILLNSVVSDNAQWLTADIKDYYLGTPLSRYEYIRIHQRHLPPAAITELALEPYLTASPDDTITFEIRKTMYGLPQAGRLSQDRLLPHLARHGYRETGVKCLLRHDTRNITICLIVDDFGVKYVDKADADHFIAAVQEIFPLKVDWTGRNYVGYQIDFDRRSRSVALSMPGYIEKVLHRFRPDGIRGAASPMLYTPPTYGSTNPQLVAAPDASPPCTDTEQLFLQQLVGCLLYYARALDHTFLTAVCALSSAQATPTQNVLSAADRLLAYAADHLDSQLVFTASDMILHTHSDGSYLSRPNGTSVAGGLHFLGIRDDPMAINGAIHADSMQIPVVTASAAETEYASLFMNGQHASWLRYILTELGYPQPPTILVCDNTTAVGTARDRAKPRRSKYMDMRFHWIRDRVRQGQFDVIWRPGAHNLADFFTKPLSVAAHKAIEEFYVRRPRSTVSFT